MNDLPKTGKVTGIGGIFFRARDPESLKAWYQEHLGLPGENGYTLFKSSPDKEEILTWSLFADDTEYFGDRSQQYMINMRVDDLDAILARLRGIGTVVDKHVQEESYGKFAWFIDPEGNRVELWEPAEG